MQLRSAVGCVHLRSTSQCSVCLSTDRHHYNDHGKWFLAATLWVWYLLSHHDNYHRNIDHTQSLSGTVPISLEHCVIRLATDRQFVWAVWLHRSTDRIGNE